MPETAGLEHQVHGLRDGHEVPRHVRMGHRDRAAALDLSLEERHDAAAAAEHVAEAHRRAKAPTASARAASRTIISAIRLVAPMTLVGCHGLVGRDQHEALDARRRARVRRASRVPTTLLADRLGRMRLHQRHVLVRRRVEHDRRAMRREDPIEPAAVPDVGDHRGHVDGREGLAQCALRMSKMLFSPWPTQDERLAPAMAICRHSSLPIEPPAPVISTCWSRR